MGQTRRCEEQLLSRHIIDSSSWKWLVLGQDRYSIFQITSQDCITIIIHIQSSAGQGSIEIEKTTVIFLLLVIHTKLTHVQVRLFQHVQGLIVLLWDFSCFNFIQLPLFLQLFNHRRVHNLVQLHSLVFHPGPFPSFLNILSRHGRTSLLLLSKHRNSRKWLTQSKARSLNILSNGLYIFRAVVLLPEVADNGDKVVIFFFHFLVMASALFCLPRANKDFHCLEDLIHAPHMAINEMFIVDLQEPMIFLVLFQEPMTPIHIFVIFQ